MVYLPRSTPLLRSGLAATLCAALTTAAPLEVEASPLDTYGYGARNIALAGAVSAVVDDSTAHYYNPANLAAVRHLTIDLGYQYSGCQLALDGADTDVDASHGLQVGIVIPGSVGPVRFGVGAALFLPDQRVSRIRALPQQQPRWVLYDNRPQRLHITLNAAVEIGLGRFGALRAGGGISFLTSSAGGVRFEGRLFKEPDRALLSAQTSVDFKTQRFPEAGLTWQLSPDLVFALVYRAESKVELDLSAHMKGDIQLAAAKLPGTFDLTSFNTNLFSPHQVFIGAGWNPLPHWLVTADLGYLVWSRYPPSAAEVNFDLSIQGLSLNLPEPTKIVDPGFHDIVTLRLGSEYTLELGRHLRLLLRGGYAFEPSPAPEQTGETNYVDNDKHVFALGAGVDLLELTTVMPHPLSIDVGGQYIWLAPRDHRKDSPVDRIGDYRSSGSLLTFAATMRVRF